MSRMCVMFVSVVVLCWLQVSRGATSRSKPEPGDIAFPDDLDIRAAPKQNYMYHHHHHDPEFHHYHHHHHHYPFNGDDFQDEIHEEEKPRGITGSNMSLQIPLEFIRDLNKYNVSDLLLNFVENGEVEDVFIQDRFGDAEAKERSAATVPKGAPCIPELQTVKIASSDDPSILYIPSCTRVERCGGCCSHALLACQPSEKENIPYKVIKTQYTGGKKLKVLDKEVILIEKHNKCKCDCRVRPEDCNKYQEYIKSECRCSCTNHDEERKCNKNNATKLWNPDLCACQCRESMQCSTGSYFDQNECKCSTVPMKRRFADYQRRSSRSEPLPVVPLNEEY